MYFVNNIHSAHLYVFKCHNKNVLITQRTFISQLDVIQTHFNYWLFINKNNFCPYNNIIENL